jgi:DnaJ-class molecular chaperone
VGDGRGFKVTVEDAVQAFLRLGIADADRLSLRDLSLARRRLALKYHPDRTGGESTEFHRMNSAYKILADKLRQRKQSL